MFPMGLVIVVLLNVELLTSNFAMVPLAVVDRRASCRALLHNFWWVIVGHILGGLAAATLFAALLTRWWTTDTNDTVQSIIDITVAKTLEYQEFGYLAGAGLALHRMCTTHLKTSATLVDEAWC